MGLHPLRTSVRYPAQAASPRPSVGRVRETRTHGLKGGLALTDYSAQMTPDGIRELRRSLLEYAGNAPECR